jgi:hypothetical protein
MVIIIAYFFNLTINLELNAPSVSLKNLTRKQSSSFLVRCNVSGHPKPRITWKKDGEMLKVRDSVQGTDDCKSRLQGIYMLPNEDKYHATVLVICKADYRKHLGQFSCTARNRLGNDTAKAFVDILGEYFILMKRKNAWLNMCVIFSKYRVPIS